MQRDVPVQVVAHGGKQITPTQPVAKRPAVGHCQGERVVAGCIGEQLQAPPDFDQRPAADEPRALVVVPQKKADAAADFAVKPAAPREAKQEAVKRETEGPAVAPAPVPEAAAPAGAAAPRAPMAESAESVAPTRPAAVMRQQATPAADAVELRAKVAPPRKEAVGAALARAPGQWLEDIREMKQQGKEKEVAEALAEFRKAYPDYRLPEDLRQ